MSRSPSNLGKKGLLSKIFNNKTSTTSPSHLAKKRSPLRDQSILPLPSRKDSVDTDRQSRTLFLDDDASTMYNHADQSADEFELHSSRSDSHSTSSSDFEKLLPTTLADPMLSLENSKESPCAGLTKDSFDFPKPLKIHKRSNKSPRLLNNVFLAQVLRCGHGESLEVPNSESEESNDDTDTDDSSEDGPLNSNEILCMEWSRDGKHLAVAGRDSKIYVWQVISSPLSRLKYRNFQTALSNRTALEEPSKNTYAHAPVFLQEPVRIFEGHSRAILTLDWSKNGFLISGAMDRTAKLWHVDRPDCLQTFTHDDFVTTAKFHPTDDRFFMSGSLDNNVRLWSILEGTVAFSQNLGDGILITALAFTPVGNFVIVGGFNGALFCFETKGLHLKHKVDIKRLRNPFLQKVDTRITGIKIFENERATDIPTTLLEKWNLLITTNDSKVRLVDIRQTKLVTRFKGATNSSSSIAASISDDNRFIISGSEDHWCYVWENNNSIINNKIKKTLTECYYEGKHHVSEQHRRLDKILGDVKLFRKFSVQRFLDDKSGSNIIANENNSYSSFHAHHTKVNVASFAPSATHRLLQNSDDIIYDMVKRFDKLEELGYLDSRKKEIQYARRTGQDCGHIIVTCDQTGLIKVYRQDSAQPIRKALLDVSKKKGMCTPLQSRVSSLNNLRLDLTGLKPLSMKKAGLHLSMERSPSFKTIVLNRLRSPTRSSARSPSPSISNPTSSLTPDSKPTIVSTSSLMAPRNVPKSTGIKSEYMTLPMNRGEPDGYFDQLYPSGIQRGRQEREEAIEKRNRDRALSAPYPRIITTLPTDPVLAKY